MSYYVESAKNSVCHTIGAFCMCIHIYMYTLTSIIMEAFFWCSMKLWGRLLLVVVMMVIMMVVVLMVVVVAVVGDEEPGHVGPHMLW